MIQPRSNSIGFWAGLVIAVSFMFAASHGEVGSQRLACFGFASMPLAIALAEMRSGYAWKNMIPGSEVCHGLNRHGATGFQPPDIPWLPVA